MDTTVFFFFFFLPFIAINRPYGLKGGVVSTSADQILFKCYGGLFQIF